MAEETQTPEIITPAALVTPQIQVIQPQNQLVSVKLDESNFLIWKQQVYTTIRGYGLLPFIQEENGPPKMVTQGNTTEKILNPEYITWERQDQLLASWILSSLNDSVLSLMVGLDSSYQIWNTLEVSFASQTKAKLMQYKIQLQNTKKEGSTMREYLGKMKSCFDLLASAGQKVSEDDKVMYILSGLGSSYDSVMVNVTSRAGENSATELQSLLLSYESRLEMNLSQAQAVNSCNLILSTIHPINRQFNNQSPIILLISEHGVVVSGFEGNEVIFAALIDMYGRSSDCRQVFDEMLEPDAVSVISGLKKCDLYLMYLLEEAHHVFDRMPMKNPISWCAR